MTIKPEEIAFKAYIADKLDWGEKTAEAIYQVIFSKNLTELNKRETKLLSVLLNSNISEISSEIFKNIIQEYPETTETLRNMRRYKNFFPLTNGDAERRDWTDTINSDEETIQHINNVKASIFDLFANNETNNETINKARWTWLHNIVWDKLLQEVQKKIGPSAYRNCKTLFKIDKYNLESNHVVLTTNTKEQYIRFDKNIIKLLSKIIADIIPELPGKTKFQYEINQTSNDNDNKSKETPKNIYKPQQNINFPLNEHINWDNCYIPNKENIYKTVSDIDKMNENVYIQANSWEGKTHLAQALCKKLKSEFPQQKIIYIKGSDFTKKYLRSAGEDRQISQKANKRIYKNVNTFKNSFNNAKIIIIDDIEQLQWQKLATQNIFKQITENTWAKIIMTSYINMTDIVINKKITIEPEWRQDYIHSSIPELFNPSLLKAKPLDTKARKAIAEKLLNTELFTPPACQGIVQFLAESNIPLTRFPAIFESIKFNSNGNMVDNDPRTAYQIIEEMTGTVIKANISEILQILLDAFNDDEIMKYLNIKHLWWFPKTEDIKQLRQIRWAKPNETDGVLLRASIYFIKKYYPQKSFREIWLIFDRSNANILYKELNEYLNENITLKNYLNSKITNFIKKKYGLLEENHK